jgi:Na+-driven multidrug efflux pump
MIFGASNNTIGYAMDYISVYAIGTLFVQLTLGMNAFITAQGFTKISMLTIIIGAVCNIILDPIFIFLFNMGVKGAALATIISQAISAIWIICFLSSKKTILHIKRENFPLKLKVILPCLFLGLSPFIMQFTESILFLSFNSSLYKYGGDLAVGAMTILSATMQFSMLPLHGLTQGSQPIISYNYGAKNTDRVKQCFRYLLISCCVYSLALWALIMLFPSVFISIFTNNADLMEYSIHAIRIYMLMTGIFGIQIACQQTFVAIGNAKTSLFLALLRKIFLLIPLIYILPMLFTENKCDSIFMAEPIADFIAVTTTSIMFFFSFKKSLKKIEKEKDITACPSD